MLVGKFQISLGEKMHVDDTFLVNNRHVDMLIRSTRVLIPSHLTNVLCSKLLSFEKHLNLFKIPNQVLKFEKFKPV